MLTEAIVFSEKKLRLPKKFSADWISKTFYPIEYKRKCLDSINTGRCYDWAYYAYCLWPGVDLWTTDMHAWVQVGELFYDSESCNGIQEHQKLRCNSAWDWDEQAPTSMSSEDFKEFWNEHGGGRKFHWDDLYQNLLNLGLRPIRK